MHSLNSRLPQSPHFRRLIIVFLVGYLIGVTFAGDSTPHYRFHANSTERSIVTQDQASNTSDSTEYDTVTLDLYLRGYHSGPIEDQFVFLIYDTILAYVGPRPFGSPKYISTAGTATGRVRAWGMFDETTKTACFLTTIHHFGQQALFKCDHPGIYRVYALEETRSADPMPEPIEFLHADEKVLTWLTRRQLAPFDLLYGSEIKVFPFPFPVDKRMNQILEWAQKGVQVVTSDPVVLKKSFYCYYWMYHMVETARVGYVLNEVSPSVGVNGSSYLLKELLIWIAEPAAVTLNEASEIVATTKISEYSKLLTNRFYSTGLFPCLRKAHTAIEVMDIVFVGGTDQTNPLDRAPHWKATLKIHTDRLISTLSDISFTIASRQNTGLFNCFVGDTRVFVNLRKFQFVQRGKLERNAINTQYSNIWTDKTKKLVETQIKHVYGHGVQYIGYQWSKFFQPSTTRSDMVIFANPCIAQEFAFSVGGSLYIAEGLLQRGEIQATKVYLPEFKDPHSKQTDSTLFRNYLRIVDVAFTPTHLAILVTDGYVILHSSSVSQKGLAQLTNAQKYKPAAFVKRRWCPRTATPKLSNMMVPMFSRSGSIVVMQVYPTEGSVRMWITPPHTHCVVEGVSFVMKDRDQKRLVNETDIHYNEFVAVKRSNHKTGLLEKPYEARPEPPPPPPRNLEEDPTFLLSSGTIVTEGADPHFPAELINPASHVLSDDFHKYNEAVIYVLDHEKRRLKKMLEENGITNIAFTDSKDDIRVYTVEFTAVEKQFIVAAKFKAVEIPNEFSTFPKEAPFQMMITTVTVTNFPFKVRLHTDTRPQDEELDTIIPFPGVIILRSKPFTVQAVKSRDAHEDAEHMSLLKGSLDVEYTPEIFTLNTAIPSYVIDFGDILVHTTLEGRYARPLHFYKWDTINARMRSGSSNDPLMFNDSSLIFTKNNTLFDAVVTEQGIISVLWRKKKRYIIQDDEECLAVEDGDTQTAAMGSVVSLEGLREVKPFFRNDNVFQRATPDGEVIYGIYQAKPHSPYESCLGDRADTKDDEEVCIEQARVPVKPGRPIIPVCALDVPAPCEDPNTLLQCPDSAAGVDPTHACLRKNRFNCTGKRIIDDDFVPPGIAPGIPESDCGNRTRNQTANNGSDVTSCLPKHAPREELRNVRILGTPFLSYLLGSLQSVRSLHPEAPPANPEDPDEPDVCPFASFLVYNTDFDFAEVGYQTRITGEISYLGTGIPVEADLIVEYERSIGIVIEVLDVISSSIEEERDLTTLRKTIDIRFEMTDFTLEQFKATSDERVHNVSGLNYEDLRARENTTVFSITLRPSIVNMLCKNSDFFKTIQFNVGCNAFSEIRLLSEASPLKRINWTEVLHASNADYKWYKTGDYSNLTIPSAHIYKRQKNRLCGACKTNCHCQIPYFKYFKDEIFAISYRDLFFPQFEQFLTVSSRRVSGNMVIYDLLGSNQFNLTVNKLKAGCYNNGGFWYRKLLNSTNTIGTESTVHENIYKYYEDCYDIHDAQHREQPHQLHASPFYMHNLTNRNRINFWKNRNQIFLFRAVIVNTYYNRFTYCRLLETFFMVRVTGIPIPRQSLVLWHYLLVVLTVIVGFFLSYVFFYRFYTWKLDLGSTSTGESTSRRSFNPDEGNNDNWKSDGIGAGDK